MQAQCFLKLQDSHLVSLFGISHVDNDSIRFGGALGACSLYILVLTGKQGSVKPLMNAFNGGILVGGGLSLRQLHRSAFHHASRRAKVWCFSVSRSYDCDQLPRCHYNQNAIFLQAHNGSDTGRCCAALLEWHCATITSAPSPYRTF